MKKKISIAVLIAFSLLVLAYQPIGVVLSTTPLSATFIDVGQGDSCWLHLPNGDDVLVDGGERQAGPTVVAYLDEHGVTDIELMVATHGDADHIGGLIDVLASRPVTEAWLDSQICPSDTCQEFYQALADNGVVTATVRMGESYPWGGVTALVLNPSEPLYADKNENSVVLRVSYGSIDFLLTGDAETGAENRMLSSGHPLEAEILKVAHHGSSSSSSPDFLSAVSPEVAVISVGPNTSGHPTEQTLSRLQAIEATIYRTDQQGTITVTTDGSTYWVSDELTKTVLLPIVFNAYSPPPPTPDVVIASIRYETRDEYIEIKNQGTASQDMTNWKIQSYENIGGGCEPTNQWYTFPGGYILDAGSSVRIHSGPDAYNSPPSDLLWVTQYIWHNDGDKAVLYNTTGSVIDTDCYNECCP